MHKKSLEHSVVWKVGKDQTKILSKKKKNPANLNKFPLSKVEDRSIHQDNNYMDRNTACMFQPMKS